MLTRETFVGPWAGLPIPWTEDDRLEESTYRADIASCCQAGVPGVYTGGTTGEFYAIELDEFANIVRITADECHRHGKPVMIGCTSTSTRGAARRAAIAAKFGADAVQVALPFWMEVPDDQILPFFQEVSEAADGIPLSIYETQRAKKTLSVEQHRAIKDAIPNYLMVKANGDTVGNSPEGCRELSSLVNVFVGEREWARLGPQGARGACSSFVYWNPTVTLDAWKEVQNKNWERVQAICQRFDAMVDFLYETFLHRGFTDTAFDRMGGAASGFLKAGLRGQGPYPSATEQDVKLLQNWYREHFPQMLNGLDATTPHPMAPTSVHAYSEYDSRSPQELGQAQAIARYYCPLHFQ